MVLIIAEAGVNHNGNLDMALKLVDAAAAAGADVVKFQTFVPEEVISRRARKAAYQEQTTGAGESQLDMVRKLRLDEDAHHRLRDHCGRRGIRFMSTPFDLPSLAFLADEMGVDTLKLPSGEITNGPLLLAAARTGCRLILSTGMATLDEIRDALGVLAFGLTGGREPTLNAFSKAVETEDGREALKRTLTLLQCTTEYPAPFADVNLRAMATLSTEFGMPVGLSDHTQGITVPIAAAALGATVVEKHFTLDRNLPGPDHKASLEPEELAQMVRAIRQVEAALGDGVKHPRDSERANMEIARKSLVARRDIRAGETFTEANLTVKRPGSGVSPMEYWQWLGRRAERDYEADEVIT